MNVEHAAAVKALFEAEPNLTSFNGAPPDLTEPPYAVWWLSVDDEDSVALCGEEQKPNLRITTHSVASTAEGAGIVADHVRGALHGKRPAIAGRSCWRICHEFGLPPDLDESTGRPVIDQMDVWTFASVPA